MAAEQVTPLIQQPQAAPPNASQVLSMGLAPVQDAVAQYGTQRTELAGKRLLLQQRLAGEKDIAQWHERAAQIRADTMEKIWDARTKEAEIRGQAAADRMNDNDLERQNRDLIAKVTSLHGTLPTFSASDKPADKFAKLTGAVQSAVDNQNKADVSNIIGLHTKLDTIDQQHDKDATNVANLNAPRAMYQMLSQSQNPQDQATLQTLNDMQAGKWVNPQTGKKQPPMSFSAAVSAAGLGQTFSQVYDQLHDQHIALLQQKDPRRADVLTAYNSYAQRNPEAFQQAAQSIVASQVPPAPGKTFEQQLQDAAKAAKGNGQQPTGAPTAQQPNPFFLPRVDPATQELVKTYVPNAEQAAVDPATLLSMAHAGASQKVKSIQDKMGELGVGIDQQGNITLPSTRQVMIPGGGTIPGTTPATFANSPLSPAEMLDRHTKGAKLAEQLSEATQDQQKLAQVLSMSQGGQNAAPSAPPQSVMGMQQQLP